MRWLVNRRRKIIHDAAALRPRCRAGALAAAQNTETYIGALLAEGFRLCPWCCDA